jgi:hypothetical protein
MIAHHGGINRVRAMRQQPHVAATWGETGHVQVRAPPCPLSLVSSCERRNASWADRSEPALEVAAPVLGLPLLPSSQRLVGEPCVAGW